MIALTIGGVLFSLINAMLCVWAAFTGHPREEVSASPLLFLYYHFQQEQKNSYSISKNVLIGSLLLQV